MRLLPLAIVGALGLLAFAPSNERAFADALKDWRPGDARTLELGDKLTDAFDREAWVIFRAGLLEAPKLPVSPTAFEAVNGWLTVLQTLASTAPSDQGARAARVAFWRALLPEAAV